MDLHGEYKWKKVKVFVDAKNITNKKYFDILGFNSRRFNGDVGVDVEF